MTEIESNDAYTQYEVCNYTGSVCTFDDLDEAKTECTSICQSTGIEHYIRIAFYDKNQLYGAYDMTDDDNDLDSIAQYSDEKTFHEKAEIGDCIPIEEFIDGINEGCFTDYDGRGELCYKNRVITNITFSIDNAEFRISNGEKTRTIPHFAFLAMYVWPYADQMSVIWYNK